VRLIFDAHLDLAWNAIQWDRDFTLPLETVRQAEVHMTDSRARGRGTVTLTEMRAGGVKVCLATLLARAKPGLRPEQGFDRRALDFNTQAAAYAMAQGQLAYYRLLEAQDQIQLIRSAADLRAFWKTEAEHRIGVILAMEGADPIVNPEQADQWFAAGLRCVGLAHYGQGIYAIGTGGEGSLTPAGRKLLAAFERLGMILDLTHCAEPGFFEALDSFGGAVHASHNMCGALVPGDRQFSDDQLHRLIERDAVIGMAFDAWMLHPNWVKGKASPDAVTLKTVVDHVDHVCQLAGDARHVGIGSDLDGGFGTEQAPADLGSIAGLQQMGEILALRGYSDADIDAIFHGNWLRFFTNALPAGGTGNQS
jgi:membrane dipeptidase